MGDAIRRASGLGLPPGTPVFVGESRDQPVLISLIRYDESQCSELRPQNAAEVLELLDGKAVQWLNIEGLKDAELIKSVCGRFALHPLVVEDILNTTQRAKIEELADVLFACLKMMQWDAATHTVKMEHVSLLLTRDTVVSFQETPGDVFGRIRERLASGQGRIRQLGSDYLAYSLIDAVVDEHFFILEQLEERVEALEDELLERPDAGQLHDIHMLRREMIALRRAVWPMRELASRLQRIESPLLSRDLQPFVRDLYDHTIQVHEAFESLRDIVASILEVYLSSVNNRLNGIMKYLTLISTVFIPLTFVTGLYGMNFRFMPELSWPWGSPDGAGDHGLRGGRDGLLLPEPKVAVTGRV